MNKHFLFFCNCNPCNIFQLSQYRQHCIKIGILLLVITAISIEFLTQGQQSFLYPQQIDITRNFEFSNLAI